MSGGTQNIRKQINQYSWEFYFQGWNMGVGTSTNSYETTEEATATNNSNNTECISYSKLTSFHSSATSRLAMV